MKESSLSDLPPPARGVLLAGAEGARVLRGQLVSVSFPLPSDTREEVRVFGKIVAVGAEGTVHVRTGQGQIVLRLIPAQQGSAAHVGMAVRVDLESDRLTLSLRLLASVPPDPVPVRVSGSVWEGERIDVRTGGTPVLTLIPLDPALIRQDGGISPPVLTHLQGMIHGDPFVDHHKRSSGDLFLHRVAWGLDPAVPSLIPEDPFLFKSEKTRILPGHLFAPFPMTALGDALIVDQEGGASKAFPESFQATVLSVSSAIPGIVLGPPSSGQEPPTRAEGFLNVVGHDILSGGAAVMRGEVRGVDGAGRAVLSLVLPWLVPSSDAPDVYAIHGASAVDFPEGALVTLMPRVHSSGDAAQVHSARFAAESGGEGGMEWLLPAPWPALETLINFLTLHAPESARNLVQLIPGIQNPALFGSAVLFFLAALRGGGVSGWLGEGSLQAIQKAQTQTGVDGVRGLLMRLSREGDGAGGARAETLKSGEWRSLVLPLYTGDGTVERIWIHERAQDSSQDTVAKGSDAPSHARFLFDLSLGRLGAVQLDGLVQGRARFDLIVRTHAPLSEDSRQSLRRAWQTGLAYTPLSGDIAFQHGMEKWIVIPPAPSSFDRSV